MKNIYINNGKKIILILFIWISCNTKSHGQNTDTSMSMFDFMKLPAKQHAGYKNERGQEFGCGWSLECLYSNLEVTGAFYSKSGQLIEIEGYYWFLTPRSQPFDFTVFLGKPSHDTLSHIQQISFVESKKTVNPVDSTPVFSNGHFRIRFNFSKDDKLYFDAGRSMALKEYDIGSLLKNAGD